MPITTDTGYQCVSKVSPSSVQKIAKCGHILDIYYLKTVHGCDHKSSLQFFDVRSKKHPERFANFWWVKKPGKNPYATKDEFFMIVPTLNSDIEYNSDLDPQGLLTIDNDKGHDGNHIKVWVGYDGGSQ